MYVSGVWVTYYGREMGWRGIDTKALSERGGHCIERSSGPAVRARGKHSKASIRIQSVSQHMVRFHGSNPILL